MSIWNKIVFFTLCIITAPIHSNAQSPDTEEITSQDTGTFELNNNNKKAHWVENVYNSLYGFFMGCDTNYVKPINNNFSAWTDVSLWRDYYFMRSSETNNTMIISSDPSAVLGASLSYKIFSYGISFNLNDVGRKNGETNGTSRRQVFSVNTSKFFGEYYSFNSGKGAEIRHISNTDLKGKDRKFKGLNSQCQGFSLTYFLNNKHYSWPAAFDAGAVQKKSCGSWSIGIQYNEQHIHFNKEELPSHLIASIDTTLLFSEVNYKDYCVNFGYNYNVVLKRNCVFAISFLPTLGYRKSLITESSLNHSILNNISTDLVLRTGLSWNNGKYFSAFNIQLHTYSYRKNKFGLTNTYGTMTYYVGLNFW